MMSGNSGGDHVVLATEHGHSGSGWQRSIDQTTPQTMAYNSYVTESTTDISNVY